MKRAIMLILTAAAACFITACSTDNKSAAPNSNSANTNAAKPSTAAAPTKEALMALEKKAFDAWKNKDAKFWDGFLADNFVGLDEHGKRIGKAELIKMMSEDKCEVANFAFSDDQMTPAGADAAVVTYKVTSDYKCDGKPMPPVVWAVSAYERVGDQWKGAYHNEMPVSDPKATPPPPSPAKANDKKAAPAADEKPAPAPADAKEDPMVAAVRKGWEAWKSQDAKALGDSIAKDFVLVDPSGQRYDHDGAVKVWTESKCEVKSFTLSDAIGTSLTKDAGIVTLKGTADGTCGGMALKPLWGTYLLVKDGENWKAAMIWESPA